MRIISCECWCSGAVRVAPAVYSPLPHHPSPIILPAHTSAFLQPLDVTIFAKFKQLLRKRAKERVEKRDPLSKYELFAFITTPQPDHETSIIEEAFSRAHVVGAFEASGLYPLNVEKPLKHVVKAAEACDISSGKTELTAEEKRVLSKEVMEQLTSVRNDGAKHDAARDFVSVFPTVSGVPVTASTLLALKEQKAKNKMLAPAMRQFCKKLDELGKTPPPSVPAAGASADDWMRYAESKSAYDVTVALACARFKSEEDYVNAHGCVRGVGVRKRRRAAAAPAMEGCAGAGGAEAEAAVVEEVDVEEVDVNDVNMVMGRGGMAAEMVRSVMPVEGTVSGRGRRRTAKRMFVEQGIK
jgi:hypothetical protein